MAARSLLFLVAVSTAAAYQPKWPAKTATELLLGEAPIPTPAPQVPELLRRAAGVVTFFFAPDNTCGFISGISADAITCNDPGLSCALAQTADSGGVVGCCDTDTCLGLQTTCYGLAEVSAGACDSQCQSDTNVILCDATASPYCVTGSFFNGILDFFCGTATNNIHVLTTFSGETDGRTLLSTTTNLLSTAPSSTSTTSSSSSTTTTSSSSTTTSSSGGGGGGGAPIGAIVGGVVGGLAVIGLVCGLIVFMVLRSRRKNAGTANGGMNNPNAGPPPGPPPRMQQSPPPGQPGYGPGGQPVYGATPPPGAAGMGAGAMGAGAMAYAADPYRPQSYYTSTSPGPVSPSQTSAHMSMLPPQHTGASGGYTPPPGQPQHLSPNPTGTTGGVSPGGGPGSLSGGGFIYEAPNELSAKSGYQGAYEMPGSNVEPPAPQPQEPGGMPPQGSSPPHAGQQPPPHEGQYQ